MNLRFSKLTCLALTLACTALIPVTGAAQDSAKPAPKTSASDSPSRWDIFGGYSYLAPKSSQQIANDYPRSVDYGVIGSVARYFNKYVGMQGEADYHNANKTDTPNDHFAGISGGLIARYPTEDLTPFVHALVGGERVGSYNYPNTWGVVLTGGGGMDYDTPWFNHRFSIRVIQADYQYTHENFYPIGRGNFNIARLSAGVVIKAGSIAPPPTVTISCAASPTSIFPGEPVTVTATAGSLLPKDHVVYTWSGQGVTGTDTTARVDTAALASGSYTVNCGVKEGKKPGKEGLKPWESASSTATFTVKEYEPPTISCSANPTTLKPGDSATVTSTGMSPQNRPLTYTYTTTGGTISGSGTTATYSSTGASTGPVQIACNVADDKGHTASANTSVTIEAPPPPPEPSPELVKRLTLHSVWFPTAQPREKTPEVGLVESQQQTLTTLATDFKQYLTFKPNGRLTLSGHADPRGTAEYNQALSERRVARVKSFLVEQGVPEASIDTKALGEDQQLTKDEVKNLIDTNSDLTEEQRKKILRQLNTVVLAQNRRVDITLNGTGQESSLHYPFNSADSITLLDQKAMAPKRKAAPKKK